MQSPSRPLAPAALPAMVPSRAPVVGAPVVRAPALARVVPAARLGACLLLFPLVAVFAGMDSVGASEMRVKRVLRRVAALADSTCTAMLAATNQCKPLHIAISQPRLLASICLTGLVVLLRRISRSILRLVRMQCRWSRTSLSFRHVRPAPRSGGGKQGCPSMWPPPQPSRLHANAS